MIIVTNASALPVTSAAMQFEPGENRFKDEQLSTGKLAQISHHPLLKWVKVEDRPVDDRPAEKTKEAKS